MTPLVTGCLMFGRALDRILETLQSTALCRRVGTTTNPVFRWAKRHKLADVLCSPQHVSIAVLHLADRERVCRNIRSGVNFGSLKSLRTEIWSFISVYLIAMAKAEFNKKKTLFNSKLD